MMKCISDPLLENCRVDEGDIARIMYRFEMLKLYPNFGFLWHVQRRQDFGRKGEVYSLARLSSCELIRAQHHRDHGGIDYSAV
jgi:hypothetical protein